MERPQSTTHKKNASVYMPYSSGLRPYTALRKNPGTNTGLATYGGKFFYLGNPSRKDLTQLPDSSDQLSVDRALTSIVHELNQPLTAISILSEVINRMVHTDKFEVQEVERSLKTIELQAKRAVEVTGVLRRFSSRNTLEKETISMNTIIHEVIELIEIEARWNHVGLVVELAEESVVLNADRILIEQVILNLARNAIEAMKSVSEEKRKLYISTSRINDKVMVSVNDNGPGMTTEQAEQAFVAFNSTKPGGMGVGLVISRTIINAHGGELCVSSSRGDGCKFYFVLEAK